MVINEVYSEGPHSQPFIETRLMDNELDLQVLSGWRVRVCHRTHPSAQCQDFDFDDADFEALPENPYFMLYPGYLMMDLLGTDITIRDANDEVVDYLSVNGYIYQQGACGEVAANSVTIDSGSFKGVQRLPDGTGEWYSYDDPGANGVPTPDGSNDGANVLVDHYRIYHPSDALTCQAASVSVRACRDASCSMSSEIEATVTLSSSGIWIEGINSTTFTGVSLPLYLRKNTSGNATVAIGSATPAKPFRCYVDGTASDCTIAFHDSGFIFDVSSLTSCQDSTGITIQAVRKDDTTHTCVGDDSFANQTGKPVDFSASYANPSTPLSPLWINGTALPFTGAAQVSLDFDENAASTLLVYYADAGKLRLNASFTGSGEEVGLVMTGSSAEFTAVPHHLRVRVTTDGTTPLDNTASGGIPHWPAGEDFTIEVAGACLDGSVTPNFAAETRLNAVGPFQPSAGTLGTLTGGPLPPGNYSAGVATGTATYSEVGTVTLQAEAADYLGSGIDVSGSTVVGRFTPYRFDVSLNNPEFAPACDSGGFSYIGQPFVYATDPVITVTARNNQNETTRNYTGEWWKITGATLTGKTYGAASGTLDLSGIPAADPVISDLGGGMGTLIFDDGGGLRFLRNAAPEAPFDAEISLSINVLDGDGIAATANPVTFGEATAGNGIPFVGGYKNMRWGRLALQNAYGSEQVALPMPFHAEYFNGSAFVTNTQDSCTGVAASLLRLSNTGPPVSGDIPIPVGSGTSSASLLDPFVSGAAGLQFSAPRSEGYIDVQADLSSLPWLLYDWNGDGIPDGPGAKATFGIYKSRPSLIYRREIYR